MFRWFIEWRRTRLFTKAFINEAQAAYADGSITDNVYERCLIASKSPKVMRGTLRQIQADPEMWGAINWNDIWKWVQENLLPIIRIVLPLVIMLLDDGE